jgi:hypothetical protein
MPFKTMWRVLPVLWGVSFCCTAIAQPLPAQAADDNVEISREPPPVRNLPDIPSTLDETDAAAVLEGIRIALSEVADGSTYVWHRKDGRLSGMAQPTSSFKDTSGQPCRHVIVMLNTPQRSSKVEGIACRMSDLRWQLAG